MAKKSIYDEEGLDGYDWYEGQPKWPMTRIVEVAFGVISVIVWVLILFRIFSSGSTEYEKMILLDERAAAVYPEKTAQVLRIFSATEEDADGSVLVYYPIYLEEVQNLQLTARINRRALPPGKGDLGYTFILRESGDEGTKYHTLSYHLAEKKFQYTFFRLCFDGVEWKEENVYTFLVFSGDFAPASGDQPYPASQSDFSFLVSNGETYCQITTPKEDTFQTLS